MSSEQNVPEGQISQASVMPPAQPSGMNGQNDMQSGGSSIPHGMGQSKSSRRRRRKRKNKVVDAGQANGAQFIGEIQGGAPAQQPQAFQANAGQSQPQQQNKKPSPTDLTSIVLLVDPEAARANASAAAQAAVQQSHLLSMPASLRPGQLPLIISGPGGE